MRQDSCSSPMKAHYRELLEFRLDVISMIPADYIGYVLHNKWFVAFRILRFERKGRLGMISYTKIPSQYSYWSFFNHPNWIFERRICQSDRNANNASKRISNNNSCSLYTYYRTLEWLYLVSNLRNNRFRKRSMGLPKCYYWWPRTFQNF